MIRIFGVKVRAHSTLMIFIAATVIEYWSLRLGVLAFSMSLWVAVLMIHEMAHCLAARRLGGHADEALLWPAGGLVVQETPHRAGAQFAAALAGPGVNLFLAIASAMGVYAFATAGGMHESGGDHLLAQLNPFSNLAPDYPTAWNDPAFYFGWIFAINYRLFLLNLLPIHPLDGGRMLQSVLWPMVGHFRSMMIETTVGMAGAIGIGLVALAARQWMLAACMTFCFYQSYHRRAMLNEGADDDWRDSFDFGGSLFVEEKPKRRRLSRRVIRKARRIAMQEKALRDRIDQILAKVSSNGLTSLTWTERRRLKKATRRQQRCEEEMKRFE
jgi:Zn-dependent protease